MTSGKAPWETYGDSLVGKDSAEMEAAVAEYAKNRHTKSSSKNDEELARWKEGNAEIAKEYQWVKPEEYADEAARVGRVMSHEEFIRTLRNKLHLKCFFREMNHPQKIALWAMRRDGGAPESVGWVKRGLTTELSIMRFDDHGIPVDERFRGWRSVLMNLVMKGFLKEHDVRRVFGRATGPASEKYNSFMQQFRTVA